MLRLSNSVKHVTTHLDILIATQMAIRLERDDIRPWTPWQKITLKHDSNEDYFQDIRALQSHVKTHKLYDKNSSLSMHNEKNFWKLLKYNNEADETKLTVPKTKMNLLLSDWKRLNWRPMSSDERFDINFRNSIKQNPNALNFRVDAKGFRQRVLYDATNVRLGSLKFKKPYFLAERTNRVFQFRGKKTFYYWV